MATIFDVIYLGIGVDIDPTEGDNTTDNASALVGNTYGSVGDPLFEHIARFSPGSTGFGSNDPTL
ncbi:hypothetical protein DL1_11210 [Thioclava dalianensis]|uniref:Uncharacterized protein n=1 Tax=Thioclava dalianensis TaxID=1185766 RepID=A0A074THT4_9RHOB|nr:hypothetical protein [Thioclava dalianensis]KEP71209.1 hypothetical protein DL1_11210 [Thioclava dalianensis]SFN22856.1 hypothetical protein SAMN05216224_10354 [Thioclava dalianensis]